MRFLKDLFYDPYKYEDDQDDIFLDHLLDDNREGSNTPAPSPHAEMKIVYPTRFEDVVDIANHLLSHRSVLLNVSKLDNRVKMRVIDFVSGAAYAIDGTVKKVAEGTYAVMISGHSVSDVNEENSLNNTTPN